MRLIVDTVGEPRTVPAGTSKTGKPYNEFKTYSFKSGNTWYQVYGKGGEDIEQGKPVYGRVETYEYVKDGETKTGSKFHLVDPVLGDLIGRVEILEKAILATEEDVTSAFKEEVPFEDIPF